MKNKIVSAEDAAAVLQDGDAIATCGFVGTGTPDALLAAIEKRHFVEGSPRDLILIFAAEIRVPLEAMQPMRMGRARSSPGAAPWSCRSTASSI